MPTEFSDMIDDGTFADVSTVPAFALGDRVEKRSGYRFPGIVTAIDTTGPEPRYVVTADHPDFAGMKHIFSPRQLQPHLPDALVIEVVRRLDAFHSPSFDRETVECLLKRIAA